MIELFKHLSNKHFINGKLIFSDKEKSFDIINPARKELIGHALSANKRTVNDAVLAAAKAFQNWELNSPSYRGSLVAKCAEVLRNNSDEVSKLIAFETGKAIRTECRPEVESACKLLEYYGGLGNEIKGETIPFNSDMLAYTIREPYGVVAAIVPWNVPIVLMILKLAPAIVAGNTIVIKSPEQSPLCCLRVIELMSTIIPDGVINIISGEGNMTGNYLVGHPKVSKITFTGSVESGKKVYINAARKLISVNLELGGKSPMIVFPDVDLDKAIQGAIIGMRFTRQGQSCTASSRIYVHFEIYDSFLNKLIQEINNLKIGDPLKEETDIGCIVSEKQLNKIINYIDLGKKTKGATLYECGTLVMEKGLDSKMFIKSMIFTGLSNTSKLIQEEIFGPVVALIKWFDYDSLIEMANDSDFGLAASIWTNSLSKALDATKKIKAGYIQINQNLVIQPGLSFGGYKKSGIGREASFESMVENYTQSKTILINMK